MLNEVNIDFRILGLPHSVVKQAHNSRVRELVKKIESHPHRHSLQRDLQQNEAYNPFSTMTKQMFQGIGRIKENDSGCGQHRIVWIARDGLQDAVHRMPTTLEWRHRLVHMRAPLERNCGESRFHWIYTDFTYRMSEPEYFHYRQNCWISLNKSGDTGGPLRNRSNFNQALSTLNRLHRESGGQQLRPMPYWKYQ